MKHLVLILCLFTFTPDICRALTFNFQYLTTGERINSLSCTIEDGDLCSRICQQKYFCSWTEPYVLNGLGTSDSFLKELFMHADFLFLRGIELQGEIRNSVLELIRMSAVIDAKSVMNYVEPYDSEYLNHTLNELCPSPDASAHILVALDEITHDPLDAYALICISINSENKETETKIFGLNKKIKRR